MRNNKIEEIKKLKRTGTLTTFFVGSQNDRVEVAFWFDDGTRDIHMTLFFNRIPVGTIPLIDEKGVRLLIITLANYYLEITKNDKTFFKEWLKEFK